MNAQTCEQFRAALRAQGPAVFNKVARSARPQFTIGRLRYWQEYWLEKLALALDKPVPTFDEFLDIFADAELMYEPPSAVPGVSDLILRLGRLDRALEIDESILQPDATVSELWGARFFQACRWIERRADIAAYVVARLTRPALQALVQEAVARLHPEYVEDARYYATQSQDPEWIADRRASELAWAELFFRATR